MFYRFIRKTIYETEVIQKINSIDMSYLPQGIYLLKFKSEEGNNVFKVVKE
jgi:hypothetical protein